MWKVNAFKPASISRRRYLAPAGSLKALAVIACLVSVGCAAPVPQFENVVRVENVIDCARTALVDVGPLDVAIAIDTSFSTLDPSGTDVDGDGVVGIVSESQYSDRDDSKLSAVVAGVRKLVWNSARSDVRFSIVTFAGANGVSRKNKTHRVISTRSSQTRSELTKDTEALNTVLDGILERGARGTTDLYAAMRRSNRTLIHGMDGTGTGTDEARKKIVLLISDTKSSTLRDLDRKIKVHDARLQAAAHMSIDNGIVINTFAVHEKAGDWRREPLGLIPGATGGRYHVVDDPDALFCHLASALAPIEDIQLAIGDVVGLTADPSDSYDEADMQDLGE